MKKYCCNQFEFFQNAEKQMGLNIRVIKLSESYMKRSQGLLKSNKVFYITEGYSGHIKDCPKTMVIKYCPFCGATLDKKYSDDIYVNEVFDWP